MNYQKLSTAIFVGFILGINPTFAQKSKELQEVTVVASRTLKQRRGIYNQSQRS